MKTYKLRVFAFILFAALIPAIATGQTAIDLADACSLPDKEHKAFCAGLVQGILTSWKDARVAHRGNITEYFENICLPNDVSLGDVGVLASSTIYQHPEFKKNSQGLVLISVLHGAYPCNPAQK